MQNSYFFFRYFSLKNRIIAKAMLRFFASISKKISAVCSTTYFRINYILKKYILSFFLLFNLTLSNLPSFADNGIDSLLHELQMVQQDTQRVKVLMQCGMSYRKDAMFDSANIYFNKALKLSEENNLLQQQAEAHYYIGSIFIFEQKQDSGFYHFDQSIALSKQLPFSTILSETYRHRAHVKSNIDEEEAFADAQLALEVANSLGDKKQIAKVYISMGILHWGNEEIAKHYFEKAIEMDVVDLEVKMLASINYAVILEREKKFDLALDYFKTTIKLSEQLNHQENTYLSKTQLSFCYCKTGQFAKGLETLKEINIADKAYNDQIEITYTKAMTCSLNGLGRFNESLNYAEKFEELRIKNNNTDYQFLTDAFNMMIEAAVNAGKSDLALTYLDTLAVLNDRNIKHVEIGKLAELETKEKELENLAIKTKLKEANFNQKLFIAFSGFLLIFSGFLFYTWTITKRKNSLLEQQLQRIDQENKSKIKFYDNIAHELRTPLMLIRGPIKDIIANKHNKNEREEEAKLKLIEKQSAHLNSLVSQILDLSKAENQSLTLTESVFNFPLLVKQTVDEFSKQADYKKVKLQFHSYLSESFRAKMDFKKIEIILRNLISNALKFTPAEGLVEVGLMEVEDIFILSVKDTGKGIRKEDLPHIFERFYQGANTNFDNQAGTGIGLSICKEYLDLMEGKIKVQSEIGKGSIFTVYFPKKIRSEQTPEIELDRKEEILAEELFEILPVADPDLPQILVVEDNVELANYIQNLLAPFYSITTADNGLTALDVLKEKTDFELIISDIMMPQMDGLEFLENIRKQARWENCPFIVLSAKSDLKTKIKGLQLGLDDYLTKPFEEEELLTVIENLLEKKNNRSINNLEDTNLSQKSETRPSDNPTPTNTDKKEIATKTLSNEDLEWVDDLRQIIHNNLSNGYINLDFLADEVGLSSSQLLRRTKTFIGLTPMNLVKEIRLEEARKLLENKEYSSVKKVAYSVGFKTQKNFSRSFKKRYGKYPSDYM